jgi:hypothetical protein
MEEIKWSSKWINNCGTKHEILFLRGACKFIGAFVKLRKASIAFVMSVCPYVRMERLAFQWKDFDEIIYFGPISKICRENSSFIQIQQ